MPLYTQKQKKAALNALITDSIVQVSEDTGISARTLRRWQQAHQANREARHAAKLERLYETLGDDALLLADAIQGKIDDAPLNQLATALNAVVDRYIKLDERLKERALVTDSQNEERTIRFEYRLPDGTIHAAPPWTTDDYRVENPLSSGGLRPAIWENGGSQTDHHSTGPDGDDLLVVSPNLSDGRGVWRDLKAILQPLAGIKITESEHRIDCTWRGGSVTIRSTHYPDLLRGAGLDFVVLDEAAYMEPYVWPYVVRPMLLEKRGGAMFISTPKGKNWFYELFMLGLDPQQPDWEAFHMPSAANTIIAPEELAVIRMSTPERVYAEEYQAMFLEDAGQVFRGIRSAVAEPPSTQAIGGKRYVGALIGGVSMITPVL